MTSKYRGVGAAIICIISFVLVLAALYTQHYDGLAPCPLCILQRYAYLLMSFVCLLAAILPPTGLRRATLVVAGLFGLTGVGFAARNVWVLHNPGSSCGIDPVENFVNAMLPAKWLPSVFYSSGDCSTLLPPLLGLQLPEWSLIWLVILTAACFVLAWGRDH